MRHATLALSSLLLVACSDKSTTTATDAGSTTQDASTTDATTATPTTGELVCDDPGAASVGPAVTVTLRNNGTAPIFVGPTAECDNVLPFSILPADDVPLKIDLVGCDLTCTDALIECGCDDGCGTIGLVQINPGGAYPIAWSGGWWDAVELPVDCLGDFCEPGACLARRQAGPASYTVRARASAMAAACTDACTCTANADGWCTLDALRGGAELTAEATLVYPEFTELEVVFE